MKRLAPALPLLLLLLPASALPQADYRIYEEHPRLLINSQRSDRLRKDAERQSARWRQLKALMIGGGMGFGPHTGAHPGGGWFYRSE